MTEDHFAQLPIWVLDELSGDANLLLVYAQLARHRNQKTGCCYPSVGRLVELTGLSERSVQRKLKQLRELQVIVPRLRGGRAVRYYLPLSRTGDTGDGGVTGDTSGVTPDAAWGDTGDTSGVTRVTPKLEERTKQKNYGDSPDRSGRASDAPPPGQRGDALTPAELLYTRFLVACKAHGIYDEETRQRLWQKELEGNGGGR